MALYSLAIMGAAARGAAAAVRQCLDDPDEDVREAAVRLLDQFAAVEQSSNDR